MPFTIACPNCDAKLKAIEALVGKTIKCPRCSAPVLIRQPSESAVGATPRLELPAEEEPEVRTDFEEEEALEETDHTGVVDRLDELPEVDDEDKVIEEAELDDADDERRLRKKQRPRGVTADDRQMAMFIYLSGIIAGFVIGPFAFVGPLILWMMKRDSSRFIDHHGKEVLNFTITVAIAALVVSAVGVPLMFVTCGLGAIIFVPLLLAVGVYHLVMTILGAMKANNGEWWEFPISIRLIK